MEVQGKVIQILPQQTGQGRNGAWRKNKFVIETQAQYPKKIAIDVWGDKFDSMPVQVGNMVTASIDVESREYNGNWYTDVKAWKVVPAGAQQAAPQAPQQAPVPQPQAAGPRDTSGIPAGKEPDFPAEDYEDDLPF